MATINSINNLTSSNTFVSNEAVTGTQDDSNTTFTTAASYIGGTLEFYVNGVLQARTSDYTESDPSTGEFTTATAPSASDILRVSYMTNVSFTENADTVDGFNASSTATANTLLALDSGAKLPADILNPGSWQSWTTTFTNLSGGTLNYAVYQQIHKTVFFQLKYTLGGAGISGRPNFTVPVTMATRTAASQDGLNC